MKQMKYILFAAAVSIAAAPALASDVGVSINVGEPGFYGQINIGNMPAPQLIYQQPVMIQQAPVRVMRQPIYLHVPPGHAKHWSKHCGKYNACGRQVYFVQDNWYNQVYAPQYRERRNDRDYGGYNDDRGGERHAGKEHGRGNGHGNGHGKHRNED